MAPTITDYWDKKYGIYWDWEDHIKRGYLGGIDYKTPIGTAIKAPVAGVVSYVPNGLTPGNGVGITYETGHRIELLEFRNVIVKPGQKVKRGQIIGYNERYLHIHIIVDGVRHNWLSYVTPSIITAAVGTVKAIATTSNRKKQGMIYARFGNRWWVIFETTHQEVTDNHAAYTAQFGSAYKYKLQKTVDDLIADCDARAKLAKAA